MVTLTKTPKGYMRFEGNLLPADNCPNYREHTPAPKRYFDWHEWAQEMDDRGFTQKTCSICKCYVIWTKGNSLSVNVAPNYKEGNDK